MKKFMKIISYPTVIILTFVATLFGIHLYQKSDTVPLPSDLKGYEVQKCKTKDKDQIYIFKQKEATEKGDVLTGTQYLWIAHEGKSAMCIMENASGGQLIEDKAPDYVPTFSKIVFDKNEETPELEYCVYVEVHSNLMYLFVSEKDIASLSVLKDRNGMPMIYSKYMIEEVKTE